MTNLVTTLMTDTENIVSKHLKNFAQLNDKDISDSKTFWKSRRIRKGDFLNMQSMVCNDLALIVKGIFRIYYHDPETEVDKNLFFFSENQFVVSFKSFVTRNPCWYYIEAMEDSEVVFISYSNLNSLYATHLNWAKFGRLLAEQFFSIAQSRTEEFIFYTHEQRYLKLLNEQPGILERIPAYHISSYLGIKNPSLSRIRRRIENKKT
ncbi:cAMP-binding domain of CRP or a regulatory subunit of cAMP-dependent protein kinases [Pedobacter westerhofensis]|uniref:cAMP-binding domain of CRP or a regulatory subunit of cAMP-dependent protein kinases n=1 Tax=Pedobacter westerhofensis TaxID=425512 RepID=A0A521AE68_9SPHI|nr:Crp/Fnr family transcriptional regulator [Pedobacter westerhofensis]SMO32990.1 cAMP-binding domain of CRP or a regulatory subunit of cAMP-dependent protein kinases [Pedobacter westerhofensis]